MDQVKCIPVNDIPPTIIPLDGYFHFKADCPYTEELGFHNCLKDHPPADVPAIVEPPC